MQALGSTRHAPTKDRVCVGCMKKLLIIDSKDLIDNGPPSAADFVRMLRDCGSKVEFDGVVTSIPDSQLQPVAALVARGWSAWHAGCPSVCEPDNAHQSICDCMFEFMQSQGE